MEIQLPPDQRSYLEQLVDDGLYSTVNEAISACVRRMMTDDRLQQQIDVGVQQAEQGEIIDHATVFAQLRTRVGELQKSDDTA